MEVNGAAAATSSWSQRAVTHLNSTQDSHQSLAGGWGLCLGGIQRDSNREDEAHQSPPCSLSLAPCVVSTLGMKVLEPSVAPLSCLPVSS